MDEKPRYSSIFLHLVPQECAYLSDKKKGFPDVKPDSNEEIVKNYCLGNECPNGGLLDETEKKKTVNGNRIPRLCALEMLGEAIEKHPLGRGPGPRRHLPKL